MTIRDIAAKRGITEVVHFTTQPGLLGILDTGFLQSRARVKETERLEYILKMNAANRYDSHWLDHVSLSITEINTTFFQVAQKKWHPDIPWAIVAFTPDILEHEGVHFATTNNVYPSVIRGLGAAGLEALFANQVRGRYNALSIRSAATPLNLTTDVQAEVLYPAAVSTKFLSAIYVDTNDLADVVHGHLALVGHDAVPVIVSPKRFQPSPLRTR